MATEGARRVVPQPEPEWNFSQIGPGAMVWHVETRDRKWIELVGTSFQSGDGLALFRNDQDVSVYLPIADIRQIRTMIVPQPTQPSAES